MVPCTAAEAQLDQLAIRVPSSANALVVIDVKSAYASPLAQAQGWKSNGLRAHQNGMIALPAQAEKFLMAAEMDFEFMQPLWEVAVAYVRQLPAMSDIATRSGGRVDRLAGADAVERPNDSFVVKLGPKVIGAMSPANRQHVNRWIRDSRRRKSSALSPYLAETLDVANDPANHIVLALDLQGLLAPAEIASKLAKQDLLFDENANLPVLAEVIASLRGIRMEVQLLSPPHGRLTLDFEQDAEILGEVAQPLLLHVLTKNGARIDDIQDWKAKHLGKSIALEGELSQSGLRRVLALLSSPVGPMAASSSASSSSEDPVAEASQRYFQAVTNYLNDLFLNDSKPPSLYQAKLWVERYARKIEDLDNHQVDPEVVTFGQNVVASLYEIVSVLGRSEMRADLRESNMVDSGRRRYGRYGAYGFYEKSHVTRDRMIVQADEANRGLQETQAIVGELRRLSAQTREAMTQRYDRPF